MKLFSILFAFILSAFKKAGAPAVITNVEHLQWAGLKPFKTTSTKADIQHWNEKESKRAKLQDNYDTAMERSVALQHVQESDLETLEAYEAAEADWDGNLEETLDQSFEDFCREENFDANNVEDIGRPQRRRIAHRMHRRHGRRGGVYSAHRFGRKGLFRGGIAGQITMTVTRTSYNYQIDFPIELFNPLDIQADASQIAQFMPNGYSYSVAYTFTQGNSFGALVFSFWLNSTPLVIDQVIVQTQEVPYAKFLTGLLISFLQVGGGPSKSPGGTIQISDVNATTAFTKRWIFAGQNILGKSETNPQNPGSFIAPEQFLQYIANIIIGFPLDAENGLIMFAPYIPGYGVNNTLVTTFFWNFSKVMLHNHKKFRR